MKGYNEKLTTHTTLLLASVPRQSNNPWRMHSLKMGENIHKRTQTQRHKHTSDKMWPLLLMCGLLVERRRQKSRLTHSKHEYKDTAEKKIFRIKQGAKCYFTIAYGDLFASLYPSHKFAESLQQTYEFST